MFIRGLISPEELTVFGVKQEWEQAADSSGEEYDKETGW